MHDHTTPIGTVHDADGPAIGPDSLSALRDGLTDSQITVSADVFRERVLSPLTSGRDLAPWYTQVMRRVTWVAPSIVIGFTLTVSLLKIAPIHGSPLPDVWPVNRNADQLNALVIPHKGIPTPPVLRALPPSVTSLQPVDEKEQPGWWLTRPPYNGPQPSNTSVNGRINGAAR